MSWVSGAWEGVVGGETIFVEAIKTAEISDLFVANINEIEILSTILEENLVAEVVETNITVDINVGVLYAEITEE